MITFEIALKGFYGGTDDTDHLVKWINATSRVAIDEWIVAVGLADFLDSGPDVIRAGLGIGIDFTIGGVEESPAEGWKDESRAVGRSGPGVAPAVASGRQRAGRMIGRMIGRMMRGVASGRPAGRSGRPE